MKKNYTILPDKMKKGFDYGFLEDKQGCFFSPEQEQHVLFLRGIDSAETQCSWGRLHVEIALEGVSVEWEDESNIMEDLSDSECVLTIWAIAVEEKAKLEYILMNKDILLEQKKKLFQTSDKKEFTNKKDVLLYGLKGRYLYIMVEVLGKCSGELKRIYVNSDEDAFINSFPEIYREEGSFFHRYISIFSSLFMDFEKQILSLDQILDTEHTSMPFLLTIAKWLGLSIRGNFLREEQLRTLLKEIYSFNRMKGTRSTLEKLLGLLINEQVIIVERNMVEAYIEPESYDMYNRLYGTNPMDFTVLINCTPDEKLKVRLLFFIEQFKPIRSNATLVFLTENAFLDSYCYLNVNAVLQEAKYGRLDEERISEGRVILQ